MKYLKLSCVVLGFVMSIATSSVLAALPEPLGPRDVSSMNFEQRLLFCGFVVRFNPKGEMQ
jgi:hypothetical protein